MGMRWRGIEEWRRGSAYVSAQGIGERQHEKTMISCPFRSPPVLRFQEFATLLRAGILQKRAAEPQFLLQYASAGWC